MLQIWLFGMGVVFGLTAGIVVSPYLDRPLRRKVRHELVGGVEAPELDADRDE